MDGPGRSKKKKRKQGAIGRERERTSPPNWMKSPIERKKEERAKTNAKIMANKAKTRTNTLKNLKSPY